MIFSKMQSIRNFSTVTVLFGLVLLCFIWGGLYYKVQSERRLELDNAVKDTANYVRAFAEHTVRTLDGLDEISLSLKYQAEKEGLRINLPQLVKERRFGGQPILVVGVLDENGDLVASTETPLVKYNNSDRAFFQLHKAADTGKLFVSRPLVGRASGKMSMQMSRRINKADGSFGGVVVIGVDPNYFAQFYQQVDLGEKSVIALVGFDGFIRIRQSGNEINLDLNYNGSEMMKALAVSDEGTLISPSPVDGLVRIRSYRALKEFPLAVWVGVTEAYAFNDLNQRVIGYYWICGAMSAVIILFVLLLLAGSIRRQKTEQELRRSFEMQSVLREIAEAAVLYTSMAELNEMIHRVVSRILPAAIFHIHLLDEAAGEIVVPFLRDEAKFIPGRRPISRGLTEYVMRLGRAVHLTPREKEHLRQVGEYVLPTMEQEKEFHYLGAPLKDSKGKTFGVMSLITKEKTRTFKPGDADVLSIIATQVSMAIKRKQAEEKLQQSEDLYQSVLAASPDGVVITDMEGFIRMVSPKTIEIFGAGGAEYFIGKNRLDFHAPEDRDRARNCLQQLLEGKPFGLQEFKVIHVDGSRIDVEMNAECTRNKENSPTGMVFILREIGERKRAEAEQQRNSAIQLVLAQIAEAALISENLDEFYRNVHSLIRQLLPAKNFKIELLDEAAGQIFSPYCADEGSLFPRQRKIGKGLAEYVMRQGRVMHLKRNEVENLRAQGEIEPFEHPAQEYLGCPLKDPTNKVFGVLALESWEEESVFRATDLDVLAIVSMQVSLGIDRKRLEDELKKQATTDGLTGILNRRYFLTRAEEELKRIERYGGNCALLMLDLDHFKKVNDLNGHAAGDAALQKVASVCMNTLRSTDLLGRIGGEEFAALLLEPQGESYRQIAERLRQSIQGIEFFDGYGRPIRLSVSIGVATYQAKQETLTELMKRADVAMYQAKAEGRNKVICSLQTC